MTICGIALRGVGVTTPTSRRLRSVFFILIDSILSIENRQSLAEALFKLLFIEIPRAVIMTRLPIIPSDLDATIYLPDNSLPSFYMEDFTVLGLRVGDLDAALRLLEKSGISIFKNPGYSELAIQQRDQIPHIIQLLNANDIPCVIADILEQVYQG